MRICKDIFDIFVATLYISIFCIQVMREYVTKVDRLEEAENLRITEKKETEYKPVVMGKLTFFFSVTWLLCHRGLCTSMVMLSLTPSSFEWMFFWEYVYY